MEKKKINFYKYELIIEDSKENFLNYFDKLEEKNIEPEKIGEDIIKIETFNKTKISNRFFGLYFESGDLFKYSENVIDTEDNLKEIKNPRKNTQIELDKQFFFLVDIHNQYIYLSDNKQKGFISEWMKNKIHKDVVLKVIVDEIEFKKKLKEISEINFTFNNEKTLFNSNTLNDELLKDLYSYDANSINIVLKYNKKVTEKIKEKFSSLIDNRDLYKTLKIIGKDDKNIDLIFNSDGILSKVSIEQEVEEKTKKFTEKSLFDLLIIKIKQHD